ncbi:hypothetical protein [Rubripirellula reticaptiva]|uniref:PEP-CTERM protein-sorting domain-containing protein n=1 Tax=Rubripirellula reticaptiva TaxID=2528013 RepID=A0A5C6ED59_9BACT|nr:hypothetical protein [Rubripirellula reticaptiva]TWU46404.1 hypothetical protein Poly59_53460 [Rubripirellula reticaptiva]
MIVTSNFRLRLLRCSALALFSCFVSDAKADLILEFGHAGVPFVSGLGGGSAIGVAPDTRISIDVFVSQDSGDGILDGPGLSSFEFNLTLTSLANDNSVQFAAVDTDVENSFAYSADFPTFRLPQVSGGISYLVGAIGQIEFTADGNIVLNAVKPTLSLPNSVLLGTVLVDITDLATGGYILNATPNSEEPFLTTGVGIEGRAVSPVVSPLSIHVIAVPELSSSTLFAFAILVGGGMSIRGKRRHSLYGSESLI